MTEIQSKFVEFLSGILAEILGERSDCHGVQHAVEVAKLAVQIADAEGEEYDSAFLIMIAMFHDAWDHKFDPDRKNVGKFYEVFDRNLPVEFAELGDTLSTDGCRFDFKVRDSIVREIDLISWSKGKTPFTAEGCVVQDADRVTALGKSGIARMVAYGRHLGGAHTPEEHLGRIKKHHEEKIKLLPASLKFRESRRLADERFQYNLGIINGTIPLEI